MPASPPDRGVATNALHAALVATRRLLFLAGDPVALMNRDYYAVLGLPPDAEQQSIRAACRDLLLALDPANPPSGLHPEEIERAETLALLIAEIEDCLCDGERRRAYDAERPR